jgi:hypothetical protein
MTQTNGLPKTIPLAQSGIRDNYLRGNVGDFLKDKIQNGSALSIVSAYFTIYAVGALKNELNRIDSLKFLFGEPRFIRSLDPDKSEKKSFKIEDDALELANTFAAKNVRLPNVHNGLEIESRSSQSSNPICCTLKCTTSLMVKPKMLSWEVRISSLLEV